MNQKIRSYILIAFFISAVLSFFILRGSFRTFADSLTDNLFSQKSPSGDIVIIKIDDQSLNQIGQWPWPRALFAELLQKIGSPAAIGFDITFEEPSNFGESDDQLLEDVLKNIRVPVIMPTKFEPDGRLSVPLGRFSKHSLTGLANVIIDQDTVIRRVRSADRQQPSFGFAAAQAYSQSALHKTVPVVEGPVRIPYRGRNNTFESFSISDIKAGKIPASVFDNKIVLIGVTASDLRDFQRTPFGLMSGVEIQANIIQMLLDGDFFHANKWATLASVVALAFATVGICATIGSLFFLVLAVVSIAVVYTLGAFIGFDNLYVLDLLYPNLAILGTFILFVTNQYILISHDEKFIRESFGHYVSPQVIQELINNPSKLKLGGERREVTVLFSDIRGSTAAEESMNPEQLTSFLNSYFSAMGRVVLDRHGLIDKYIGDALMAFWGAPLENKLQAEDAVRAALDMHMTLHDFNEHSKQKGFPSVNIGVSINSGQATVGNMGSLEIFNYTVVGDNVNLASRLEKLNKIYSTKIIASESTINGMRKDGRVPKDIITRELDHVRVRGRQQPVKIYEIIISADQATISKIASSFDTAREMYYEGKFNEAAKAFDAILGQVPGDVPSQVLRGRCVEFAASPPNDWRGIMELTHI